MRYLAAQGTSRGFLNVLHERVWFTPKLIFFHTGQDETEINYDTRYALKLCQEYNLTDACVQLSALLGLWESAVDLALSVDVELAKQTVPQLNNENAELCRKLWLKIGKCFHRFETETSD